MIGFCRPELTIYPADLLVNVFIRLLHLLYPVPLHDPLITAFTHGSTKLTGTGKLQHGRGKLRNIHNMCQNSCRTASISLAINELTAVSHIRCNHRLMCGITLQYGKRLPFTDTGQNGIIHPSQILPHINTPCKYNILYLQRLHKFKTLPGIFLVLITRPHNPELQAVILFLCKSKSTNHGLNILNRSYTQHGSDIDISLIFLLLAGEIRHPVHINSIGRHPDLALRTAQTNLQLPRMRIQTCHHIRPFISQT